MQARVYGRDNAQHAWGRREAGGPEQLPHIGARLGLREDLGGPIVSRERLGGILNYYCRAA